MRDKQTFTIFLYYIKSLINSQFVISFNSLHYNNLKMLKIYLFGSRVRIASLLFAKQRAIHRVVLLQLHSLHLLLDRVHGGGLICSLVHEKKNVSTTLSKRDYYHTCALECVFIIFPYTLYLRSTKLYFLIFCTLFRGTRSIPRENGRVRARSSRRRFQ